MHIEALWDRDLGSGGRDPLAGGPRQVLPGVAARYVAFAPLIDPDVEPRARRAGRLRPRRRHPRHPQLAPRPREALRRRAATIVDDPGWRRGLALLERYGLGFDLMIYPYQAAQAARLAADFPGLTLPAEPLRQPRRPRRRGHAALAGPACGCSVRSPTSSIKISNLGAYDPQWTYESLREVTLWCIECFGPGRSLFASDYPVARLQMTYDEVYGTFKRIAADFTPDGAARAVPRQRPPQPTASPDQGPAPDAGRGRDPRLSDARPPAKSASAT